MKKDFALAVADMSTPHANGFWTVDRVITWWRHYHNLTVQNHVVKNACFQIESLKMQLKGNAYFVVRVGGDLHRIKLIDVYYSADRMDESNKRL